MCSYLGLGGSVRSRFTSSALERAEQLLALRLIRVRCRAVGGDVLLVDLGCEVVS